MILSGEVLNAVVVRMGKEPQFKDMCATVGVSWLDVCDTVTARARILGVHGQEIVNFMLLSAAVGFLYAKGERLNGKERIQ